MKNLLLSFGLIIPILGSWSAVSADQGPKNLGMLPVATIAATAMDAASSTFEVENAKLAGVYGLLLVLVTVTDANDSTTAVTMTCTTSADNNSTDYTLQVCTTAAGACTSSNASWVKDPSAITSPKRWVWRVDVEGLEDYECTFTDTGGAAADTIAVSAYAAVKGS